MVLRVRRSNRSFPRWAVAVRPTLAAPATMALVSCAALLGIEDATCDPSFDPACATRSAVDGLPVFAGAAGALANAGTGGGAGSPRSPGSSGSSTSAGASGAGLGQGGGPALGGEPNLCARYCDAVTTHCSEGLEQYASEAACLAVCATLPAGEPGALSGNSVECRLTRAELAGSTGEPSDYCSSAGPGGGGVCGSDCEGYCEVMSATCDELGDRESCLAACAGVPDLSEPPASVAYNTGVQDGDSLQCRLFHVSAATLDPISHCVHAAGLAVCTE